jgi:hypothetical protein
MTNSERLGHFLIALPIAHVLGSSLFLWSYCAGFGSRIIAFTSVSDLFAVSIRHMVPVYALSIVVSAVLGAIRWTYWKYPFERAFTGQNSKDGTASNILRRTFTALGWGVNFLVVVIPVFVIAHSVIYDERTNYFAFLVIFFLSFKYHISRYAFEMSTFIVGFILSVIFVGLRDGQTDRYITYATASGDSALCGKAVVLRGLADNFLAILPNGKRVVIASDCVVKFEIPTSTVMPAPENHAAPASNVSAPHVKLDTGKRQGPQKP